MTAVAVAAAAAEKETPYGDGQSARCHADQANADARDDANENGQENMRSDVREQLAPPALLERTRPEVASRRVVRAMMRIVMRVRRVRMVRVMMRRRRVRTVRVVESVHLASMAVPEALETLQFLPGNRQPSAQNGRAFLDIVRRVVRILGQTLVDLRHEQTALAILDELDLDAGDAVNEGRANLDDLKLNLDKLELAIGVLLARADLETKSKALRLGRESIVAVMSMLSMIAVVRFAVAVVAVVTVVIAVVRLAVAVVLSVIAVGRLAVTVGTVTMGRLVVPVGAVVIAMVAMGRLAMPVATTPLMIVFSVMPLHALVPVDNLRCREGLVQRVTRRVQLEAVDEKTVMVGLVVDGKGQFEMVRAMDLELETLLRVLAALHQNRAARAFHVDDLALGNLRADALDGVGNLDIGLADLGGQEKSLGRWKSQKARRDREGSQQHGADGDDSRMVRYEGVSSITARAEGGCCVCLVK